MKRFLFLMSMAVLASVSSCVPNRRPVGAADNVVQAATPPVIRQEFDRGFLKQIDLPAETPGPESVPAIIHDTVTVENTAQRRRADSLGNLLMVSEYKIARVKYYLQIAINKPSQRQFLVSWLRRIFGM